MRDLNIVQTSFTKDLFEFLYHKDVYAHSKNAQTELLRVGYAQIWDFVEISEGFATFDCRYAQADRETMEAGK